MLKRITILLCSSTIILLTAPAAAEPPTLNMNDFAYGAELEVSEAEFMRFNLNPDMVKNIRRNDLGDVRIFDVNNELLPSLVRKKDGRNKLKRETLSPSRLQTKDDTIAYVLDRTADHKRSLKALSLQWRPGTAPNMLQILVEHSADKNSWETLKDSETVNNFKFEDIALTQNIIDINSYTQRYIKLSFQNKKPLPVLATVHAYTSDKQSSDYTWIPAGKLQAQAGTRDSYHFQLDDGIRPELVKLRFPSLNTILNGQLSASKTVNGKQQYQPVINNFNAYVVTINNKVVKSRPINISRWQSNDWLITASASKNIQEDSLPGVDLAYPQYEIIFASNNEGPYTVVWGNPAAGKPVVGDIIDRLKKRPDIVEIKPGATLNNRRLTELMESRQTPWLMISISLAIVVIAVTGFAFASRRYRSGKVR